MEKMSLNHVFLFDEILDFLGLGVVGSRRLVESLDLNEDFKRLEQEDYQAILDISYVGYTSNNNWWLNMLVLLLITYYRCFSHQL
jgi:hypothetical protein